jgi:hypothetical protein
MLSYFAERFGCGKRKCISLVSNSRMPITCIPRRFPMRFAMSLAAALLCTPISQAADNEITFTTTERVLPAVKSIVLVKAGEPGPGSPKFKAIAEAAKYGEVIKLPKEGPYDVWWQGKDGLAAKAIAGLLLKGGEKRTIKLTDYLGVVNFRGDGQPRATLITIAAQDDPGPDEKGHRAIQTAKDYRVDMVVPEGFYSLWIIPENSARPRKINDRFRVQAGKTVVLD